MISAFASPLPFPPSLHQGHQRAACRATPRRVAPRSVATPERSTSSDTKVVPIEDRDVPVAHKGLHESLYGTGDSSAVHGEGTIATQSTVPEFHSDGEERFEVKQLISQLVGLGLKNKVACVYKTLNSQGVTTFVGMTRNLEVCLRGHTTSGHQADVEFVHVRTFAFPSRARLQRVRDEWISALDYTPIGIEQDWNESVRSAKHAMTAQQREHFENTKRKLRQAIADPTLLDEEEAQAAQNNSNNNNDGSVNNNYLKNAVEGDDWSAVINQQTAATTGAATSDAVGDQREDGMNNSKNNIDATTPMVSPFASQAGPTSAPSTAIAQEMEFSVENADKALDGVRPMLQADGGDVRVIGVVVAEGVVTVRLIGACGSCTAAATTLRLGIESALRGAFPTTFKRVQEIGMMDAEKNNHVNLSKEAIDAVLDAEVRTPMAVVGGSVTVVAVDPISATVTLQMQGPHALAYGVELVVREKVRGVKSVVFV